MCLSVLKCVEVCYVSIDVWVGVCVLYMLIYWWMWLVAPIRECVIFVLGDKWIKCPDTEINSHYGEEFIPCV